MLQATKSGPRAENQANARATVPPHRRHSGQCLSHPGAGCRGWIRLGHVRRRRRLPDDAASDLHRHFARGRGRVGIEPHGRIVVFRRALLLAQARHRPDAVAHPGLWRRGRHRAGRLGFRAIAKGRTTRSVHCTVLRDAADHRRNADGAGRRARHPAHPAGRHSHHAPGAGTGMDPRHAAENALQAVQDLSLRHSGHRHRTVCRLSRRHHGYRRWLSSGPR